MFLRLSLFGFILAGCLRADMSYQETTRFTGGSMMEMLQKMAASPMGKLAGGRMSQAFEDQTNTIYLKDGKLARINEKGSTIFDLDAGTVTTINHERRTYSVMTFDEIRQMTSRTKDRRCSIRCKGGAHRPIENGEWCDGAGVDHYPDRNR